MFPAAEAQTAAHLHAPVLRPARHAHNSVPGWPRTLMSRTPADRNCVGAYMRCTSYTTSAPSMPPLNRRSPEGANSSSATAERCCCCSCTSRNNTTQAQSRACQLPAPDPHGLANRVQYSTYSLSLIMCWSGGRVVCCSMAWHVPAAGWWWARRTRARGRSRSPPPARGAAAAGGRRCR